MVKQKDFQKDLQMHLLMPTSDQQLFAMLPRKTYITDISYMLDKDAKIGFCELLVP